MLLVLLWGTVIFEICSVLTDFFGDAAETGQHTKTLYAALLEELHGAHLRIAATNLSATGTMVIKKNPDDGTFSYSGYAVDACQYMAELFHFNYTFVNTRIEDLVKLGPRETEANFLLKNEADIAVTHIVLSLDVFRRLDISIVLYYAGTALIVPWPDEESRLLAPIHPFQQTVWLILLVAILTVALLLYTLPGIYDKVFGVINNNPNDSTLISIRSFGNRVFATVANITGRPGNWPTRKQFFYRILLGSWCLAALVLVNAYSSLLISYLTIPKLKPTARNFDDLTFNNVRNLGSLADKNSISMEIMAGATDASSNRPDSNSRIVRRAKIFADMYRKHPEWLFTTPQQRFDLLYTGHFAHGFNEHLFYSLLRELNEKAGYCKITVSNKRIDDLLETRLIFLYQKNWRYTDAMRNKMQWWADTGLALHWVKSYQPSAKGCLLQDYKKNVHRIRTLTLKDLSSAFVVLLMGCGLSLLAFLIEKIHYYRMMRHNRLP